MATYAAQFTADTVGSPPAGWSARSGDWTGFGFWNVAAVTSPTDSKVVQRTRGSSSSAQAALTWNTVGDASDVEVLSLLRFSSHTAAAYPIGLMVCGTTDKNTSVGLGIGYYGQFQYRAHIRTPGALTEVAAGLTVGTWYWCRVRISGSTVSAKVWADGTTEPASWMASATSTTTGAGWVGLFADNATGASSGALTSEVDFVSAGTAGATAPGLNVAPNAPILTAPADGAGIDRNSVNRFDWDFSDPDAGDSQSAYNLRYRLIGAGTWTETGWLANPNTYHDSVGGTFAAGDYEWQAATKDAQGAEGPYSSSSFFTAGDAPPAPTITAPINGATFSQTETVVWSAPDQDAYQLRILDGADAVVSDTGEVTSTTARSRVVEFPVNNVARKIQVRVKDGGLWSPYYTISGNVSWTPPAMPVVSLLNDDGAGALVITVTNPAPTGDEPPVNYNDIYVTDPGKAEERRATMVPPNSSWTYHLPPSGFDGTTVGDIRVEAVADNGIRSSS